MRVAALTTLLALVLTVAGCGEAGPGVSAPEAEEEDTATQPQADVPPPPEAAPDAPAGLALIDERCTDCHTTDSIHKNKTAGKDRTWWERTIKRMTARGAKLDDAERETMIDYLTSL